jgi:uncharacterized protein with GYD domain
MMKLRSLILASAIAFSFAIPASAQQATSSHLYMFQFKIAPIAAKAYIDNPQDRTAANRKLAEGFGGKLLGYYLYPPGEYDGMTLVELPDETSARAIAMTVWATGTLEKLNVVPLITAEEWKGVMEKAKQNKTVYTPPTETK